MSSNQLAQCNYVAFANDIGVGSLKDLKICWLEITHIVPFIGYFANRLKSWLIIKERYIQEAENLFADTGIKITSNGRKHLGAFIGSEENKETYIIQKVECSMPLHYYVGNHAVL